MTLSQLHTVKRTRLRLLVVAVVLFVAVVSPKAALALSSEEAVLARELWQHGFNYIQIAAILGNAAGESGCDPAVDYDLSGMFNWDYEWGCGLFGYTDCGYSPTQLVLMQRTELKVWAAEHGWDWASTEAQVEFTFGDSGGISWRDDWMDGLAANGYYWGYSGVPENMEYDATPDDFLAETRLDVATYSWMACYGRGAAEPNHFAEGLNEENNGRLGEAQRVYDEISTGAYDLYFMEYSGEIPEARAEEIAALSEVQEVEVIPVDETVNVSINDPAMPTTPTGPSIIVTPGRRYIPQSDPVVEMPTHAAGTRSAGPKVLGYVDLDAPKPVAPVVLGVIAMVLVAFGTYVCAWVQWRYVDDAEREEDAAAEKASNGFVVPDAVAEEYAADLDEVDDVVVPAADEAAGELDDEPEPPVEPEPVELTEEDVIEDASVLMSC